MKNLIFLEFTEKSDFQGGLTKNQYRKGNCFKRGGAWIVCRFKGWGVLGKEKGGVFEAGLIS